MKINDRAIELTEALLLILILATLFFCDPFQINYKITDLLRLKFPVFIKEPKLLFYTHVYVGAFIAKIIALAFIAVLAMVGRVGLSTNLAVRPPRRRGWIHYIVPFIIFAAAIRIYYSQNPLIPNLPLRLVFPEAMIAGNAVIILSVLFIAPITEELIFRGYLFDVFERNLGPQISILATSAIFALAHMPQLGFRPLETVMIFVLGMVFGAVRYETGSSAVAMLFHGLYNLVYVIIGFIIYLVMGY